MRPMPPGGFTVLEVAVGVIDQDGVPHTVAGQHGEDLPAADLLVSGERHYLANLAVPIADLAGEVARAVSHLFTFASTSNAS